MRKNKIYIDFLTVLRHRMEPITVRIKWKTVEELHSFLFPKGLF